MNETRKYFSFYFILFFAWSSVYTLITIYLSEAVGFKLSEIGTLMSALPIITMVFQPIWGAISDGTEKKKRLLICIMFCNVFLALIMTIVSQKSIVFLVYCLYTAFLCAQSPLTDSMAVAQVNYSKQGTYGAIRAWGSAGYAIGAYLVAQIVFFMGLKSIFYIAAIGLVVSMLLLMRIIENKVEINRTNYLKDLKRLLSNKEYVFVLLCGFFIVGTFLGGEQYLGLYFRSHGIEVSRIGILNFLAVCVEVPFIFNSKRLIRTMGTMPLMLLMIVVGIVRLLMLSFASNWTLFILTSLLRGVFVGIFVPLFIELVSEITPKQLTSSGISIYSSVTSGIAAFIFTLLGGIIADRYGYTVLYGGYSLVFVIPLLLVARIWIMKKKSV